MDNINAILGDLDDTLARILDTPSWAQQIVTATAGHLRTEDPFLALTDEDLTATLDMVTELITGHLPTAVAEEAMQRVAAVLPQRHYRETCDAYAWRMLQAARAI
ncbi:hypothetical protein SSPNP10_15840 [Streptomyces sp. NP10]|uniref:hypothetical protein n=1 Tax=Streptomyces sp. NP10 TaxID=1141731 RepID=UPI000F86FB00|nr:hypothetical protein [Streptomyces sp. NP10]RUP66733.1 hypothetical protein SSPNP10_15840 [Streptomyces sp. NP10]